MHVTLVNPPSPSGATESIHIPLGIGYLAAVLEKKGYTVDVIDCHVVKYTPIELEGEFIKRQPDVVGVTSTTLTYKPALETVKTAKEACPNCLTMVGGPHVSVMAEETLREYPEVDVVVRGEGEQTLLELADLVSMSDLGNLDGVAGITFRKNGQIVSSPDRPLIQDLDELPFPAYKYFPLSKYRLFGKLILPVITSRGCPHKCTVCLASKMFGNHFRARSPKNVVDELELLRDRCDADAFAFYDSMFTYDKKRVFEICEEIKNRNIGLPWDCQPAASQVSRELLAKMRDANCQLVYFGVESGCQTIMDAMNREATVEQNEKAIKWAKEVGLSVAISMVVGYPGETPDTLKQTLDFIRRVEADDAYLCVATPYPGTELRTLVESMGWKMSSDWNLYDTVTPVFENPVLGSGEIIKIREAFHNSLYSPYYVFRQSLKRNFYSRIMARIALNHLLWRMRTRLFRNYR